MSTSRPPGLGLTLPLPARTRVLREIAADLEALTDQFVAQGLSHPEARARAEGMLVPDASAVAALEQAHRPWYGRLTRRLEEQRVRAFERSLLVGLTALLLGGQAAALVRSGLLDAASPYLWPLLFMGAALGATVALKAFELWVRHQHDRPRRGLRAIAVGTLAIAWFGLTAFLVDLITLARSVRAQPEWATELTTQWLIRGPGLLAWTIVICLAGALAWYVLRSWVAIVEHGHAEAMRSDISFNPTGGMS